MSFICVPACNSTQEENIQDALLRQIPSLAKKLDYMVLRSSVCPRLLSIIVETGQCSRHTTPTMLAIVDTDLYNS